MISTETVEALRKQKVVNSPAQLLALLDVVTAADRLTDALGEFGMSPYVSEAADAVDAALVRLRDTK